MKPATSGGPVQARVFRNGRNQAVRIPVELAFATEVVTIERHGDGLLIRPWQQATWARFLDDPSMRVPDDFDTGDDPPPQERSDL